MLILGIETSCDETAAALVRDGVEVLSNVVASSQEMHQKTGGIIPEQAAREQIKCILPVVEEAMKGYKPEQIDAIAVTYGPGLIGSLLVGVETAKTLSYVWKKPIVPVNHLVGHIYANFVRLNQNAKCKNQNDPTKFSSRKISGAGNLKLKINLNNTNNQILTTNNILFPAMVLIVSGGHTELVLMKSHGSFEIVGQTRDDAAGEAFDKIARILDLGYPGGPAIQHAAIRFAQGKLEKLGSNKLARQKVQVEKIKLPRPMLNNDNLDFSFSGLKTAVLRLTTTHRKLTGEMVNALAYETQEAITEVLVAKIMKAAGKHKVKSILLAGGVAANKRLREALRLSASGRIAQGKYILSIPPLALCTDNAVSIASAGFFNCKPVSVSDIIVDPGLEIN